MSTSEKREILPNAIYRPREVAELLGLEREKTVREIPPSELVPTYVGPRRGRKVYRGSDILTYLDRGRPRGLRVA